MIDYIMMFFMGSVCWVALLVIFMALQFMYYDRKYGDLELFDGEEDDED